MNRSVVLFIISAFCLFIATLWYRPGFTIGGGDEGLTYAYPDRTRDSFKYSWYEAHLGQPQTNFSRYPTFLISGYLFKAGVPADTLQITLFLMLLLVAGASMYLLSLKLFMHNNFYALTSSLFYLLNPYMYASIWHRFQIPNAFFMSYLPLAMFLFYKFVNTGKFIWLTFFLIVSFIFAYAFSLPSNIITLWVVLGLLSLSFVITSHSLKTKTRIVALSFVALVLWAASCIWWLIPFLNSTTQFFLGLFPTQTNIDVLRSISSQFPLATILSLGYKDLYSWYQIILACLMLALICIGILIIKDRYWKIFITTTLGISLFMSNGSNPPLGFLFEYLFRYITPLQLFRNPYEKFGIVLVLVYALLFALGLEYVFKKGGKIVGIVVLLLSLVFFIPFWFRGTFGDPNNNAYIKVPLDYEQMNTYLNKDPDEFRVLHIPLLPGSGLLYNWPHKYSGLQPNFYLFDKNALAQTVSHKDSDEYWQALRQSYFTGKIASLLKFGNVKYILMHRDLNTDYAGTEDLNTSQSYLKSVNTPNVQSSMKICQSENEWLSDPSNSYLIYLCKINQNWSEINFVHLELLSSVPGKLKIYVGSPNVQYMVFDGVIEDHYQISKEEVNKMKQLVLDFRIPTERYSGFDLKTVRDLTIYFYPDPIFREAAKISVVGISPDKGKNIPVNYTDPLISTNILDLYKVKDVYTYPKVYAARSLSSYRGWDEIMEADLSIDAFVFDHQKFEGINYSLASDKLPQVSFKKVNSTKYQVDVKDSQYPFWLIFSEAYHPLWEASGRGNIFSHLKLNGYANGYLVDQVGDFSLNIEYKYEAEIRTYRLLSALSLLFVIVLSIYQLKYKNV